jgi:hypothetical protein
MDRNSTAGIVLGAGMLLLHGEGREVLKFWLGHADRHVVVIGQAPKPAAAMPEHADDRQAESQMLRMSRASQVTTPSAMMFLGAPESPAR